MLRHPCAREGAAALPVIFPNADTPAEVFRRLHRRGAALYRLSPHDFEQRLGLFLCGLAEAGTVRRRGVRHG